MDQTSLAYLAVAAIVLAMAGIIVQTVVLVAIYRLTRRLKEQVSAFIGRAEPAVEAAEKLLEDLRRSVSDLSAKTSRVLELSQQQLVRVDEILSEATARSRVQMERIELVLDDLVSRIQQTTALIENSLIRPIRHINGLAAGIRAAIAALAGTRTTVAEATHDEEMFI